MKEKTLDGLFNVVKNMRRSLKELAEEAEDKDLPIMQVNERFQSIFMRGSGAMDHLMNTEVTGQSHYEAHTANDLPPDEPKKKKAKSAPRPDEEDEEDICSFG